MSERARRALPARPADAFPEPRVRGEGVLRAGERVLLAADRAVARLLPHEDLNPLARTGALALLTFIVAAVTGILLLFWYSPSVHGAWESVAAMSNQPWSAGLLRSLHRYSSDASLFLATVHLIQMLFRRRFGGARWFAWVTGFVLLGLLWLVGWTGYWLVWDERAGEVGRASARLLDVLPVFADPLSRSFLTDEGLNSLLFFMVFFVHMLLPLAMAALLWLHVARVSRAKFMPGRALTIWSLAALALLSLLLPADLAPPARMAHEPGAGTMDAWFLMPMAAARHFGAGASWAALVLLGAVGLSTPWLLAGRRRAPPAAVTEARCEGCEQCFRDCPYGAIEMRPRTDGAPHAARAFVRAELCVGCGICTASCATSAIGIAPLPMLDARSQVRRWAESARARGAEEWLLIPCGASAGADLALDPLEGTCAQLPGWRVLPASCVGWVHASVIEAALAHGLQGVLLVACGPAECPWREGVEWAERRMAGTLEPAVRAARAPAARMRLLRLDRTRQKELIPAAAEFQRAVRVGSPPRPLRHGRLRQAAGAVLFGGLFAGVTWLGSVAPWSGSARSEPMLVVSFKHPGAVTEVATGPTPEELERMPVHMRPPRTVERRRADVRLQVEVDGAVVLERSYPPRGIWGDGASIALEEIPVAAGARRVAVRIADGAAAEWNLAANFALDFLPRTRCTILYDRTRGFRAFAPDRAAAH